MKMDASAFVADPELLEALKKYSSPVDCEEDRVLFNQGDSPDGLYIFHKGVVRLVMRAQQGETLMNIPALEGSLLGLPGLESRAGFRRPGRRRGRTLDHRAGTLFGALEQNTDRRGIGRVVYGVDEA